MTGLHWWEWRRAERRLAGWVGVLVGTRPYRTAFRTGEGSSCDFGQRLVVVEPDAPRTWGAEARALPTTWGKTRVERAGELEVLCARALAAHEAGHVVYTTTGTTTGGAHHHLTNILEDERVERLVARDDRRAAVDLAELGLRSWRVGCTPAGARATRLVNAALYHRWDARRPVGEPSRLILDDPDERRLWEEQVRPRVEEAWEAPDTGRVALLAREILSLLGVDERADAAVLPGLLGSTDGGTRGERGPGETAASRSDGGGDEAHSHDDGDAVGRDADDGSPGDGDDDTVGGEPSAEERAEDAAGDGDAGEKDDAGEKGDDGGGGGDGRLDGATSRRLLPPPGAAPGVGRDRDLASLVAAADLDPSEGVLWMQPFADLEGEIAGAVGRLAAELRVRAPAVEDEPNRARGRLDARAAVRTRGARPLVRGGTDGDSPEGLAVLLLIDGTGSMQGYPGGVAADGGPRFPHHFTDPRARMPHVRRAALLVQRACASAEVPLAIAEACASPHRCHLPTRTGTGSGPLAWIQRYDDDPEAEGPRALIAGLYGHAMEEAVCAALAVATPHLLARPEGVKLVLYVHDGQPDDDPEDIRAVLAALRARGLVVRACTWGRRRTATRLKISSGQGGRSASESRRRCRACSGACWRATGSGRGERCYVPNEATVKGRERVGRSIRGRPRPGEITKTGKRRSA